jgi:RNA polymerase sigma-70 factor (ECF subfamily)
VSHDVPDFDEIVRAHRQLVYRVARRIVRTHEEADEVTQETFVRAWRALSGFRGESRLSTWLVRIAIHTARSLPRVRFVAAPLGEAERIADRADGPDALWERREDRARLRSAVRSLPPRQREVVALKVFSDMTYEDVASVLGLTVGAVKAHLHQAVGNLRRRLAEDAR